MYPFFFTSFPQCVGSTFLLCFFFFLYFIFFLKMPVPVRKHASFSQFLFLLYVFIRGWYHTWVGVHSVTTIFFSPPFQKRYVDDQQNFVWWRSLKQMSGGEGRRGVYYFSTFIFFFFSVVSRDQPTIAPLEPPWAHLCPPEPDFARFRPISPDFARISKIPFFGLGVGSLGGV